MKKIFIYVILFAGLFACDLDINNDPSYPSDVSADLIFPSAQNAMATVIGDQLYNYSGFFAQYYDQMPEANQYNNEAEYNLDVARTVFNRPYQNLYAGALADLQDIFSKTTNTSNLFAAQVLRTFCFQVLVDNLNVVPYTEALQGSAIPSPAWDNGQSVYEGVLAELDEAESALGSELMTLSDLLLSQNMSQWRGFANALRLRMYLRFIDANIDAANYTSKVKALVDAGNFFSGDVKYDVFADEANKRNPWYSTNRASLAANHVASYPIIEYLKITNDPRIEYNFERATNTGDFAGELPGSKQVLTANKNADFSFMKYYPTKPVYFFTQSELQFLLAEIYLRFYDDNARAQAAYEAAIDADFSARGMEESPETMYGTGRAVAWSTATTTADKLELIYMQKWVALCYMDHMEAWSELRRTDVPELSPHTGAAINADATIYTAGNLIAPMTNALGGQTLIKRVPYPQTAIDRNKNTPSPVSSSTAVWWDVK
ncbi:SusD/RagB family nutrient-binding outer membrane lipoprotein [uncultured Proteiniphilum sp.]|uniref:SusD/RagB family nutrient-binding outer membrane lipoprotein n=1 Tax=uncultured Proteiniphilum sp. TaxID=497637 RepID=UPI002608649A|nr:SusD/RagB family nutrient-binding outer membrane lipoprotein [uncultured Proteiniphilum sp.]